MANVENLGTLERRVSMALAADDIERKVDERLKKLARSVRMPGFRPGKVPLKLVAQQYGPQVRSEVIGDAVEKSFSAAVRDQNLRVAGYPRIERKEAAGDGGKSELHRHFRGAAGAAVMVGEMPSAAWTGRHASAVRCER